MVTLNVENVWTEIVPPWTEFQNVHNVLQRYFTVDVPGAKYLWAYKSGEWDGTVRLFEADASSRGSFRIMTGLYEEALNALLKAGYKCQYEDKRGIVPPSKLNQYTVPLRAYQHEVLEAALGNLAEGIGWFPRGILQVATGGGKTEIAVAMYQTYPVPTVMLVHRKDLLLQAAERFKKYGIRAGVIGAGRFDVVTGLNILTTQTAVSCLKRYYENKEKYEVIAKLLKEAQQVFFDEAHIMASSQDKGNQFTGIANLLENAHARWGLTATPFMRTQFDNLLLKGSTGEVLASISNDWLIKHGYLTPPKVIRISVPGKLPISIGYKTSNKAKAAYFRKVKEKGITSNAWRNERIAREILCGPGPLLALVSTIEQAKEICYYYNKLSGHKKTLLFLSGTSKAKERVDAAAKLNNGQIEALLTTTIFDEGIDIPNIRKLILCSGGKSQVKMLQRIGRGLRLGANKHVVEVIDFKDEHHAKLKAHAQERFRIWKAEGFEVVDI